MDSPNQKTSLENSDDNETYAINVLKDLPSDSALEVLDKLHLSSKNKEVDEKSVNVPDSKDKVSHSTKKQPQSSHSDVEKVSKIQSRDSTYSCISTPPTDSKSTNKIISDGEIDVSYSSDFTQESETSKEAMTAWDKWFVIKHEQLRRKAELEKKKKILAKQKQEALERRKAEENDRKLKEWREKKKNEIIQKKEQDKTKDEKTDTNTDSQHKFENWFQKKLQEKKSEIEYNQQIKKSEDVRKAIRLRKNEIAHKEWMMKAKQRPLTPRITYGYVGESVIGFYDSTSNPPPTYVNPIPWQQ